MMIVMSCVLLWERGGVANYANNITTTTLQKSQYEKKQLLQRSCYLSVILLVCYMSYTTIRLVLPTLKRLRINMISSVMNYHCVWTHSERKNPKLKQKKTSPLFKEANHSNFLSEYWMFTDLSSASSFSKLEPRQVSRQYFYLKRL